MKVLLVDDAPGVTGAFRSITRMVEAVTAWHQGGGGVHFCYTGPGGDGIVQALDQLRVPFSPLDLPSPQRRLGQALRYPYRWLRSGLRLRELVQELEVDLVHVNDVRILPALLLGPLDPGVPVIVHVRILPTSYMGPLFPIIRPLAGRTAVRLIAVSQAAALGWPPELTTIIHNGATAPDELPPPPPEPPLILLYPANYTAGKGHETALRVFERVLQAHPTVRLRFVGGDLGREENRRRREALKRTARRYGKQAEVMGYQHDMASQYQRAHVVLNFSRSESFSQTCLEAQSQGRPVVATRSGGPEEIVVDGETGRLADVDDVEGLARALSSLLDNPDVRTAMGRASWLRARSHFHPEKMARGVLAVYRRAFNR